MFAYVPETESWTSLPFPQTAQPQVPTCRKCNGGIVIYHMDHLSHCDGQRSECPEKTEDQAVKKSNIPEGLEEY